jgi:hypothetical protein
MYYENVWAEILPVGKGMHALPFLCKACFGIAFGMTQNAFTSNSYTKYGLKHRL